MAAVQGNVIAFRPELTAGMPNRLTGSTPPLRPLAVRPGLAVRAIRHRMALPYQTLLARQTRASRRPMIFVVPPYEYFRTSLCAGVYRA